MRRLTPLALAALLLAACQDLPTSSPAPDGLRPSFAAAFTETINVVEPIDLSVFVPCANGGAGEIVELTGELHVLLHVTENDNGFHVKSHFQPQGASGTGLTTGDKYQGTGVSQDETNVGPGETFTVVNNFRIIGQGPGNNFLVHENVHVTVNANGTVTVIAGNLSVECR